VGDKVGGVSPAAQMRRSGERGEGVVGGRSELCRHDAVSVAFDVGDMEGMRGSGKLAEAGRW